MTFERQKELFALASQILKIQYGDKSWSFGGGTALAACYWGHRNSTDIDIFLHDSGFNLNFLRPTVHNKALQSNIYASLNKLGFCEFYVGRGYIEYVFADDSKIQFILSPYLTTNSFELKDIFGFTNIQTETPSEIIAKKLFYRGSEYKARDLIDISIAVSRDSGVLVGLVDDKALTLDFLDEYKSGLCKFGSYEKNITALKEEVKNIGVLVDFAITAQNAFTVISDAVESSIMKILKKDMQIHRG